MDENSLKLFLSRGLSVNEIAARFDRDPSTVSYWMRKYGLHTLNRRGPRREKLALAARDAGLASTTLACPKHGETEFTIDARGCYRCRRCRSEAVTRRRRAVKATLVAEAGGRCLVCGYDRCHSALAFHHLDPSQKRMVISAQGMGIGIARLRVEASKCVLLCHNCHAEVETGATQLPIQ